MELIATCKGEIDKINNQLSEVHDAKTEAETKKGQLEKV